MTFRGVPGAAQHEAKRNGALQTRDRTDVCVLGDPGSAVQRLRCTASGTRDTLYVVASISARSSDVTSDMMPNQA